MFKEIEFKYKSDGVSLVQFIELMKEWGYKETIEASSWDKYFTKGSEKDNFLRFRMGKDRPELTKKRKTTDSNNWDRVEVDLPLDPNRISEDIVDKFVELDGFEKNFKIFKSCFIFMFDDISAVWYVVQDENLKEKARFIEIEVNKELVEKIGEEESLNLLKSYEEKLSKLGITYQNRMKKSLFELFVK